MQKIERLVRMDGGSTVNCSVGVSAMIRNSFVQCLFIGDTQGLGVSQRVPSPKLGLPGASMALPLCGTLLCSPPQPNHSIPTNGRVDHRDSQGSACESAHCSARAR